MAECTAEERAAMIAIVQAIRRSVENIDPYNPWPWGCEWWHMHNEIYRRNSARRKWRLSRGAASGNGEGTK